MIIFVLYRYNQMNKTDIIKEVSKSTKIEEDTVRTVFNSIIETIQDKLVFGLDVKIKGFMNLTLKINNPRKIKSSLHDKVIEVPRKYSVKVTLSQVFKDRISQKDIYIKDE